MKQCLIRNQIQFNAMPGIKIIITKIQNYNNNNPSIIHYIFIAMHTNKAPKHKSAI